MRFRLADRVYFYAESEKREPVFLHHISPHTFRHSFATRITEINTLPINMFNRFRPSLIAHYAWDLFSCASRTCVRSVSEN